MSKANSNQITLFLVIIFSCCCCCCKFNSEDVYFDNTAKKFALLVLEENRIGQTYTMEYYQDDSCFISYKTTFIGKINNSKGDSLNFMLYNVYYGIYEDCPRTSSRILIFKENKLLGYYYIEGGFERTPIINGSDLIIFPFEWDEECYLTTTISFRDSIPQEISIKYCNQGDSIVSGEVFSFCKEKY